MRDYSKISPAVWQSARFNSLPSDDGRYLDLYLLTCSHQTSAGCYVLPEGYACSDLRWEPERYRAACEQLIAADLVRFDPDCDVVLITRWFKHNPPMSESHLIGIERQLERLPSFTLYEEAQTALWAAWKALQADKVAKAQRKGKAPYGASNGLGGASPERLETNYLAGRR
jgi:hypothetical protein